MPASLLAVNCRKQAMPVTTIAFTLFPFLTACSSFEPETGQRTPECVNADSDPKRTVSFARDIRPLMNRDAEDPSGPGCKKCHYATYGGSLPQGIDEGKLDMTTLGALRKGGKTSGTSIVVPTKPCDSAIVRKLEGTYPVGAQMPRDAPRPWNAAEVQLVIDWIMEGAQGDDKE